MASHTGGRGGVGRVEKKLEASIQNGNYYEAHQMYRTLFSRYMAQNRHKEVQNLMQAGAFLFFSKNESGSGVDLSLLLLDSLESAKAPVTEELIVTIGNLHKNIGVSHPQLSNFEVKAITWSTHTDGVPKTGHAKIRHAFAHNLWKEKLYGEARQHFLYSNDGVGSGEMLVEFSVQHGKKEEDDLFIAQFVLQLLCIQAKQPASDAFNTYTEKHPRCGKKWPFTIPLLNFLFFLLSAVETQKLVTFTTLCDKYQTSLNRDPTYFQYLERIGENFFGVKLPKKQKRPQGLMGNLFQGLMDGDKEGGDNLLNGGSSSSTSTKTSQQAMTVEDLD
ncbi:Golgi to ER traffic protein 4 homolog [Styela clava]|uniref:Golgi to ER traffic protein 4 homolog n=1 Tax=Styela clava TaxID=7725 RepID=UPI00193AB3CD|nr:Golgi to ER traffic protein 4 homolog [Styela clava]